MDKYDAEIEEIVGKIKNGKDVEDVIMSHWCAALALFTFCSSNGDWVGGCGCLTQVKSGNGIVADRKGIRLDLSNEIKIDGRLHENPQGIVDAIRAKKFLDAESIREVLRPYAEWQRRLDSTIRNSLE